MIERHEIKTIIKVLLNSNYKRQLDSMNYITEQIKGNDPDIPYFMNSLHEIYLELAAYELYLNNSEEFFWGYIKKSAQCCLGFYKLALSSSDTELIQLDDIGEYELKTGTYINFITPWKYRSHFKLALLTHNNELLRLLAQIKEEKFDPEQAGLSGDEFHWAGYRYINEILNGNDDTKVKELYKRAFSSMVEYYEDEGESYKESTIYFDLEQIEAIRLKDNNSFNKLMAENLEAFKKFYGESGNQSRADGLFAPFPTGLAAFAYDQGMEITVESDYMPRFLVEGRYAEEKIKWPMG